MASPLVLAVGSPLSESEVLLLLVHLTLLIGVARALGGLMKLVGQPPVVGELLAGIILGPTVFGRLAPDTFGVVFGDALVRSVDYGIAWISVIVLLVVVGYETDLGIISRFRRAALSVSAGGLLLPLMAVGGLAFLVPDDFVGEAERWIFAGFFALAFAVAALPVVAKILQDLGLLRRNFGQITLAAGMSMDSVGWLALAALSGLAQDGFDPGALAVSFGGLVLFIAFIVFLGRRLLDGLMRTVLDRGASTAAGVTIAFVAALAGGAVTQALRLEAVLGAFLVGVVLASLRHQVPEVRRTLETMTAAVFAPIFFAFSGLRVDLGLLDSVEAWLWAAGIIVAATIAKLLGVGVGARAAGIGGREALALGSGLSALGAMGIVVAIVGLNLGVVSDTGYTVMVLGAIVTSVVAPFLLKGSVRGWEASAEERERLEREELAERSEILGSHRILIPTRGGRNSVYAAGVITSIFPDPEVTVLAIDVPSTRWWRRLLGRVDGGVAEPSDVIEALDGVTHRLVRKRAKDPAQAIARESRLGYDLVLLGASEEGSDGAGIFSTVVDRAIALVDLPTVVVRSPSVVPDRLPQRVLVPVAATPASRAAEEMAYSLAARTGGRALALHVVNRPEGGIVLSQPSIDDGVRTGETLVASAMDLGGRLGVSVDTAVRAAPNAEAEIVDQANSGSFDVLFLGASNRPLTDRPFFGHRVTYMIEHSRIPVAIVALPARRT